MSTARVPRSATARPLPDEEGRSRHLRVVGPRSRRAGARGVRITARTGVVLTVLLFAALFAVAVSHALLIESQIRLDRLDEQVAGEQARYERNRLDVAELESPDRIVAEARDRLGMVPADDVVWLAPDQPAPATGGDGGGGTGTTGTTADGSSAGDGDGSGEGEVAADSPDTSWATVKPYLEPTP